jgi:cell division protein FtsL
MVLAYKKDDLKNQKLVLVLSYGTCLLAGTTINTVQQYRYLCSHSDK